jgi:hypothetical protein
MNPITIASLAIDILAIQVSIVLFYLLHDDAAWRISSLFHGLQILACVITLTLSILAFPLPAIAVFWKPFRLLVVEVSILGVVCMVPNLVSSDANQVQVHDYT